MTRTSDQVYIVSQCLSLSLVSVTVADFFVKCQKSKVDYNLFVADVLFAINHLVLLCAVLLFKYSGPEQ